MVVRVCEGRGLIKTTISTSRAEPYRGRMPVVSRSVLAGRSVLVTGGSGAFGNAFVRRALEDGARRVVVFSRGEAKQAEMRAEINDDRARFVIGDVRDADRVLDACRGVDYVIHAAAMKRVESCERDPVEAVKTNIVGTLHVARACIERGVQRAVILSTDKAAAPATLYGCTKLAAERAWLAANVYAAGTQTRFSGTRYGNVVGSTGSAVPTWRAQAQRGEAITITDPAMTRFYMPMSDAVNLVVRALTEMRGGEVYVPRIAAASVGELAVATAPGATWRTIGVRGQEKMHETLISADEAPYAHDLGDCYVIEPAERTWGDVAPLPYPKVPAGFEYRSDLARGLEPHELSALVAA
jgi:UDP-N-acetylglucosamine 4,6-dehydratase